MSELKRKTLSTEDFNRLSRRNWPAFGLDNVVILVEAWNAGHDCNEIGAALGLNPRSLTMCLGAVKNAGVVTRDASRPSGRRPSSPRAI